ncbi:MAG: histidine kinase [Longimicrobiales bacterium]
MDPLLRAARRRWPLTVLAYVAAWTVPGLIGTTQLMMSYTLRGDYPPLGLVLALALPGWYVWALLAPVVVAAAVRMPLDEGSLRWRVPAHLGLNLLVGGAWVAIIVAVRKAFGLPGIQDLQLQMAGAVGTSLLTYWVLVGLVHLARYHREREARARRASELAAQLADARLSALKSQLHPHFLFNTMHAISAFVRDDPAKAEEMLAQLAGLLRTVLDSSDAQVVPLADELDFVRRYLAIQEIRLADRLDARIDADPDTLGARVPSMVLQPLVENAVEHGIARRRGPGRLRLEVRRANGRLRLDVRDDGPGLPPDKREPSEWRVGLRNTRERLSRLYGTDHVFTLDDDPAGGTRVRVEIPWDADAPDARGDARSGAEADPGGGSPGP